MNLTKDTTEEQILEPVKAARQYLASLLEKEAPDSEHLLNAVHAIWAAEALARARYEIVGCLQSFAGDSIQRDTALRNLFIAILSRGADDSWSGRKNDARRVAFDAVRKEIGDLRWSLVKGGN